VRSLWKRCSWVVVVLALLLNARADALEPAHSIAQYKHSRWVTDDGVPTPVNALIQGADGYLWIGSRDGLYRYDGLRFERIAPQHPKPTRGTVTSLLVAHDGAVWAGDSTGGISVYRAGTLHETGMESPGPYVISLAETRDGAVWASLGRLDGSLGRYTHGRWQIVNTALGMPREYLINMLAARNGTLWITTIQSVMFLPPGASRFQRASITPSGHAALAQDAVGNLWMSDDRGTRVIATGGGTIVAGSLAYPTPRFDRGALTFFDAQGNLWGSNRFTGIFRVRSPSARGPASVGEAKSAVEVFRDKDGLLTDNISAVAGDKEGNIWVGSTLGLERFRTANVVIEPALRRSGTWAFALLAARNGAIYVGQRDGVYRVRPNGAPERLPGMPDDPHALCEARDGTIWIVFQDRVVRLHGNVRSSILLPRHSAVRLYGCAVDKDNRLWISADGDGIFHRTADRWHRIAPASADQAFQSIGTDEKGRILVMSQSDGLLRFDTPERAPATIVRANALQNFWWFQRRQKDLMFAGPNGLLRLRDGRLSALRAERVPALAAVTGIETDGLGNTWMMTRAGVVRLATTAFERVLDDPHAIVAPIVFDVQDGLPGSFVFDGAHNVARGGDGRIWFATTSGIVWVDPARIVRNRLPPAIAVSALKAGGKIYRDARKVALPAGTSSGEIDYSVLSLSIPQRVQVRYKLEGSDEDWVDAGSRREMFFSHLGPGVYRFRVIGSNNDGVWNRTGSVVEFTIPPTFVQSLWFKLLCALAAVIVASVAYSFHLRRVRAQLRAAMEVRLAERERIARELHDSLLQSFQGLILRFQMVAGRMPKNGQLRQQMDAALDKSDEVLIDVRDRVQDLRATGSGDLASALLMTAGELSANSATTFRFIEEGTPRALDSIACEEIRSIGEEALRNAFHHAEAQAINLAIAYGRQHLRLSVTDDGIGVPDDVVTSGERPGHFGLRGMRERAKAIGGSLTVTSRKGKGTEVLVTIPARAAYSGRWRARSRSLAHMLVGG